MTRTLLAALALACVCSSALADVAVPVTTVSLPWGDWLVAAMQPVTAALVPLAAAAIVGGIARVAPWAASILTRQRVEAAIQAGAAYGMNAIPGAVKGKVVTVDLGSAVVAAGAQHIIDEAPAAVIKAAGGPEGIAARIFRSLPLDENSGVANVLEPAVQRLKNGTAGSV